MDELKQGLVSIIVPAYNVEKYIRKCLSSICRQTYRNLEIIVVDDGSTDSTGEMLDYFSRKDKRIRVFHQDNAGTSAARNNGLDQARGEYLVFVDSDDYIAEDYIERLLKRCQSTGADMVICGLCFVDSTGKILKKVVPDYYQRGTHEEWTFRISAVAAHFYRRQIWEENHVRFSVGERGEDMPVALFFSATCKKIAILPYAGYAYVQHSASAMGKFRGLRQWNLPLRSLEDYIQRAEEKGIVGSRDYFELFIMRIFSTCFLDLARGADRKKLRELADYIIRVTNAYLPDYRDNKLMAIGAEYDAPTVQKAAVVFMCFLIRTRQIYLAADLLSLLK